jgi:Flp pilus assembly protein TadB
VTGAVAAGALLGLGLWLLLWGLVPARTDHTVTIARLDAARTAPVTIPGGPTQIPAGRLAAAQLRLGGKLARWSVQRGLTLSRLRADLALLDRGLDDYLGSLLGVLVVSLIAVLAGEALWSSLGLPLPGPTLVPLAMLLAVAITAARVQDSRTEAAKRRRQFRRALSAYFELVARSLMGGTGVPEALPAAAAVGAGWPFRLITETLDRARAVGSSTWRELAGLGARIGVDELHELGTSLGLVGQDGARIATTLVARASTLRRREIADLDGRAKERANSARLSMVLIFAGFLLFVLYPAVTNVVSH